MAVASPAAGRSVTSAKITDVERILLVVPFVQRVRREMERARIHAWSEVEVIRVVTDAGVVGYGETIQNYTWGRVNIAEQVIGRSPFSLMWDALKECEREGSLDAAIVPASELPNDFEWLLTTYPTIQRICFNGSKSATAFTRLVLPTLPPAIRDKLALFPLPSSSPANRTVTTADKLARWRAALISS